MKKLVLLACASLPLSAFAQGGLPDKPYIYVEGKAEVEKPPDMVTLRFDLVGRNADQAKANQEVQTKANKILVLLKEKKIGENDIIAGDIKSEPQIEGDENNPRRNGKIIGYKVARYFEVKVRDVNAFPKLVDELLAIAGVEFAGTDAGLTKEKEISDEIFAKALSDARDQAAKTAKAMDMKLDSVFLISPVAYAEIRSRMFSTSEKAVVTGMYVPNEGTDASHYILAPMKVSQSVHVIYLISPAK
jgi:uncharacterized protein YggE